MKDTIYDILKDIKPRVDFTSSDNFIEDYLLESMEIMRLISELNEEFDINITLPYIKATNFESVDKIVDMISEILEME